MENIESESSSGLNIKMDFNTHLLKFFVYTQILSQEHHLLGINSLRITVTVTGIFLVFSGTFWYFWDFFPNKKIPNLQKKNFFFEDWDFHSVTTHTS